MDKGPEKEASGASEPKEARPDCFGDLDRVFPMGQDGLRESPPSCLACAVKTECLARAAASRKASLGRERLDREVEAGKTGFLNRWSRKKHLHRLASERTRK